MITTDPDSKIPLTGTPFKSRLNFSTSTDEPTLQNGTVETIHSIKNFRDFVDMIYEDVLLSIYVDLGEKINPGGPDEIPPETIKKADSNIKDFFSKDPNSGHLLGRILEYTKIFFLKDLSKKKDNEKVKLTYNEDLAKQISKDKKTFSEHIEFQILKFTITERNNFLNLVLYLEKTLVDMSSFYLKFKKNENIKENFSLLQFHFQQIIERFKKVKIHKMVLFLLDEIFLRIFKWEQKTTDSTDSFLLRNAFSHDNYVYDESSLISAGRNFEEIFLKRYTLGQLTHFKNSLNQGLTDQNQRIVFYNTPDNTSKADALLDTTLYDVCRYFMTYCHSLYSILTLSWANVPFSGMLLNRFKDLFFLDLVSLKEATNKADPIEIVSSESLGEDDMEITFTEIDGSSVTKIDTKIVTKIEKNSPIRCNSFEISKIGTSCFGIKGGNIKVRCSKEIKIHFDGSGDVKNKRFFSAYQHKIGEKIELKSFNNYISIENYGNISISNKEIKINPEHSTKIQSIGKFIIYITEGNSVDMNNEIEKKYKELTKKI
ncbi:hypothetical protein ACTFIR_002383 [Dictyostelium discoideum]